jgi:hypothetical protein
MKEIVKVLDLKYDRWDHIIPLPPLFGIEPKRRR